MKKACSLIVVVSFILLGLNCVSAFALTDNELLEKINSLEKQVAELRSELEKIKAEKTKAAAPKPEKAKAVSAPKFTALPELKLYGFIKTDFSYDDSRMNNPDAPGFVLSESNTGGDNQFAATAQNSRFGLDMKGPELWDGNINGKVEIDFLDATSDNSFRPRIRHLYTDLVFPNWSLLFGQTWDVIGPLGPATLNTNGWLWRAGNVGFRRTQARLTNKFTLSDQDYITTKVSANRDIGNLNGSVNTGEDAGWPLMEGRISFATNRFFERKLELGVGGLYGEEEIDRSSAANDDNWKARQWGVIADALIPVYGPVTLKGEFFYGSNLDAFLAGIGQGVNTTKEVGILAYGGWGQISYKFNDYITLNGGYGIDNADDDDLNSGDRYRNQVIFANAVYSPIKQFKFGLEYSYWYTEYLNAKNGDNNRIQGSVIWNF